MGLIALSSRNFVGVAMAAAGFDWQSILLNFLAASSLSLILAGILGATLGPAVVLLGSIGFGVFQLDAARKEVTKAMKKELVKHLPKLAEQQQQPVYEGVQACFDKYEEQVMERIEQDICDRSAELNNLLAQKQTKEIDRDAEINRLKSAEATIRAASERIDIAYQSALTSS